MSKKSQGRNGYENQNSPGIRRKSIRISLTIQKDLQALLIDVTYTEDVSSLVDNDVQSRLIPRTVDVQHQTPSKVRPSHVLGSLEPPSLDFLHLD